jgi:hypothetical protein
MDAFPLKEDGLQEYENFHTKRIPKIAIAAI